MAHTKILYRTFGEGPLLILLHGYAGSVLHWDPVVQNLQTHYQLVVPNLTHLYMSNESFTFSQQVDVLAKFIQVNFSNRKVHLAGASYGGALLWGVALRYPQLVDKTIFINPMPPAPMEKFSIPILNAIFRLPLNIPSIYMILRTPLGRFFLSKAMEIFRVEGLGRWERHQKLHGRRLLFICHVIHNFSFILKTENWKTWQSQLPGWTHPSLLIFDQQDPLFKPKTYHQFQELIGCDETRELYLAGHIATNIRGLEISEMIKEFLDLSSPLALTS